MDFFSGKNPNTCGCGYIRKKGEGRRERTKLFNYQYYYKMVNFHMQMDRDFPHQWLIINNHQVNYVTKH